jgi:hypothetical protein
MQVTLLDGKKYDHSELIDNMSSDEFYYSFLGLDKALSYSSLKWLLKSPKWFEYKMRNPSPETQALRDGRLVHAQILEPSLYKTFHFVDVSSKNTKKWKLAVDQYGKANTYTNKEKYMNNRITTAFMQNDRAVSFLKGAQTEVPALEHLGKIPVRAKADILGEDFVADVKTTNDGVKQIELKDGTIKNQFAFTIDKYDYDLQAYLYTLIYKKKDFYWLVVDKTTTDIGIFKASEETLAKGKLKLEACLQLYEAFFIDELIDLSQFYVEDTI